MGNYISYYFDYKPPIINTYLKIPNNEKWFILNNKSFRNNFNEKFICSFCCKKYEFRNVCISCGNKAIPLCDDCFLIHNHYHDEFIKCNSFMGNSKDRKIAYNIGGNPF